MLCLDIIEHCNFKCWFCRAKDLTEFKYMSVPLFKRLVLEAKELGITQLDLIPAKGEPFLHPNIYELLDFANEHMDFVIVFTNVSAINVSKLKKINLSKTKLCVSYYGSTVEKFKELTCVDKNLFDAVHKRLKQLDKSGIKYSLERRDYGYEFDSFEKPKQMTEPLQNKCSFHTTPKIFSDGSVTFCKFSYENFYDMKESLFDNVTNKSLKEVLENPLRYKFFDSQSLCESVCTSYDRTCSKPDVPSFKILLSSKMKYLSDKLDIDNKYRDIENAIIQRTQQQIRN